MVTMGDRPVAAILTLGCKLNIADSDAIARGLQASGFDVVDRMCEADAFVVNTCSVTHTADQKSRRLIRSVRRLSPHARVTVTGCFPRTAGQEAITALGADLAVGASERDRAELVAFLAEHATRQVATEPATPDLPRLRTRAFIAAQSGCNDVCAFCIVPRTRGREVSRLPNDVVADVRAAVGEGAREVVITGTQLGAWGRDLPVALRVHHLIAAILEQSDAPRIRFSSLQPQDITPELLALWQDPRLMPHFHLALQSGSESVLARMRRRYTAREFVEAAARIRAAATGAAITTDVIAGFPGESDTEFEETLALCREVGFARLHCFPYSQRSRTTAARMPEQVAPDVRKARMARLLALGGELASRFQAESQGQVRPVLWEEEQVVDGERVWHGHTDTYISAYAHGSGLANRITPALLGMAFGDGLGAEPIGVSA